MRRLLLFFFYLVIFFTILEYRRNRTLLNFPNILQQKEPRLNLLKLLICTVYQTLPNASKMPGTKPRKRAKTR